jgi:uncharacterized protein (TIGR01777 family)
MKIVIPGGSGKVGAVLTRGLLAEGHEICILSRRPKPGSPRAVREVAWDGRTLSRWTSEIDGADAVINLAGRSVDCRYTKRNRDLILNSRVDSTRVIGEAIAAAKNPPPVWLQASTATIYAHRFDTANDEATGILGGAEPDSPSTWRFSIDVAKVWEKTLADAKTPHTRKVALRSAMTMSPDPGSVFEVLSRLVRFGLGGRVGSGRQFVSWIHETDFVRSVDWLLQNDELEGAVNLAAPNPLPYSEFMAGLRQVWKMPIGLPAPEWLLEIATAVLRTESELVLKSRRVIPGRLIQHGFQFEFPEWASAAAELANRSRSWKRNPQLAEPSIPACSI